METIVVNRVGKLRRVTFNGRRYIIAPMTLIVPGVLNGSSGRLFYPLEEIRSNYTDWNYVPIVINHPYDAMGNWQSARDEGVIERSCVGFLWKAKANNKLTAQGWMDEQRLRRLAPKVYDALLRGVPVELSTGLGTLNYPVANGTHHNGKFYDFIARSYMPDHLAILPDVAGACSLRDGCGVLVNQEGYMGKKDVLNADDLINHANPMGLSKKALRRYRKAVERELIANMAERGLIVNAGPNIRVAGNANPNQARHPGTGQFLPYGAGTGSGPAHDAAQQGAGKSLPEAFEDGGKGTTGDDDDDDPNEPPEGSFVKELLDRMGEPDADDKGKPSKAKNQEATIAVAYNRDWPQEKRDALPDEDFAGPGQSFPIKSQADVHAAASLIGKANNPDAVKSKIKAIAKRKGLSLPDAWKDDTKNEESTVKTTNMFNAPAHDATKQACAGSIDTGHEPAAAPAMKAAAASKAGDGPGAAAAHTEAAGLHEQAATDSRKAGDDSTATGHDNAAALHRKAASLHGATMNAGKSGETPKGGNMAGNFSREAAIKKLTANCTCAQDIKAIQNMSDSTLKLMVGNDGGPASADAGPSPKPVRAGGIDDQGDNDDDDDKPEKAEKGIDGKKDAVTKNQAAKDRPMSLVQALNQYGTQDEKDSWANVQEFNQRLRKSLTSKLTANAKTGAQRDKLLKIYSGMTTNQLKDLVAAMPEPTMEQQHQNNSGGGAEFDGLADDIFPNFTGAGGHMSYAGNSQGDDGFDKTAILIPATVNWDLASGGRDGKGS